MTENEKNAKVFKAFCDSNRLCILELLQNGEQCACVLLEKLKLSQSGLSYHMKILVDSGIVTSRQVGKWTHYKLNEKGRENAIRLINLYATEKEDAKGCICNDCEA